MLYRTIFLVSTIFFLPINIFAQQNKQAPGGNAPLKMYAANVGAHDSAGSVLTLKDCLRYALKNQPALNQTYIDQSIARTNNAIAFSPWLPQVSGAANYQHYFQLPTVYSRINGTLTAINSGVYNTSNPSVAATQTIFSNDLLLGAKASKLNIQLAKQNTVSAKIDVVSEVSKAFYDLLLSIEQIGVYKEDTSRLKRNESDAYNRYVSGLVDKVDYKQASIALNNSLSQLKSATEAINAKYASLKQLMGVPPDRKFEVSFDTMQMMQEVYADTAAALQFEKRIEYQQLQTARRIQRETTMYYQLGFLPTLSAYYNYNYQFQNNEFSQLYDKAYPNSYWGLQLNVPLFTGLRRMENIHKSKLQEERIDWDEVNVRLVINAQYSQALAAYKSNVYYLHTQADNVGMAREVYDIVKLQYREGIKAYLDVIIAESQLQTSEINYLNALFQLLASKIDLERAMGDIPTDI